MHDTSMILVKDSVKLASFDWCHKMGRVQCAWSKSPGAVSSFELQQYL